MPYIIYLANIKKNLNLKHFLVIFIIGLNSSLIYDFPSLVFIFVFSYFFREDRNNSKYFSILAVIVVGMLISSIPSILSILGEPTHRVILSKYDLLSVLKDKIKFLINSFIINDLFKLFYFPITLLKLFLVISIFFIRNKQIRLFLTFLALTYFINIILDSEISQIIFNKFLSFLQGYNFARVTNLIPFFYSILLVLFLNFSKNIFYKKFLISMTIVSSISLQIYLPVSEFFKEIFQQNIKENYLIQIKENYKNKNFKNIIRIINDENSYLFNSINYKVDTGISFDSYYKIEIYDKIKKVVGDSRVASVGIDPMIAPMNDIKAIDGYHQMFSLSYKNKFRKIIKNELEQNEFLRNYYDFWGNRVYMFFSDKNDLLLDFKEAKKIGADFIIAAFPIDNENLALACSECNYNNELYLYRIL